MNVYILLYIIKLYILLLVSQEHTHLDFAITLMRFLSSISKMLFKIWYKRLNVFAPPSDIVYWSIGWSCLLFFWTIIKTDYWHISSITTKFFQINLIYFEKHVKHDLYRLEIYHVYSRNPMFFFVAIYYAVGCIVSFVITYIYIFFCYIPMLILYYMTKSSMNRLHYCFKREHQKTLKFSSRNLTQIVHKNTWQIETSEIVKKEKRDESEWGERAARWWQTREIFR